MRVTQAFFASVACSALFAGSAHAITAATFADPATDGATPMFTFNAGSGTLTGGWSGSGLLFQAPLQLPDGASYPNTHFTMTPLGSLGSFGNIYHMGGGQINFTSAASAPLLTITFSDAWLTNSLGLGSDFMSNSVTFSGPIFAGYLYPGGANDAFSFSFANPRPLPSNEGGGFACRLRRSRVSMDLYIPSPATTGVILLGGVFATRRRRRTG